MDYQGRKNISKGGMDYQGRKNISKGGEALRTIGQRLGRAFGGREELLIDGYRVIRREKNDSETRQLLRFYTIAHESASIASVASGDDSDNLVCPF